MEPLLKARFPVFPAVTHEDINRIFNCWLNKNRNFNTSVTAPRDVLEDIINRTSLTHIAPSGAIVRKEYLEEDSISYSAFSFKHPTEEPGVFLDTKLCFKKDDEHKSSLVSVELDYSTASCRPRTMEPRKPVLINHLIDKLPPSQDGWMTIKSSPHSMVEGDDLFIIDFFNGVDRSNSLPLVYVSRENQADNTLVSPEDLARRLAGFAHVLLEPNHAFSSEVKKNLSQKEMACYDGAVRIYWPNVQNPLWNKLWTKDHLSSIIAEGKDPSITIFRYVASRAKSISLDDCSFDHIVLLGRKQNIGRINSQLGKMRDEMASKDKGHQEKEEVYEKTIKDQEEMGVIYEETIKQLEGEKLCLQQQVSKLNEELTSTGEDLEVARMNLQDFQRYKQIDNGPSAASNPEVLLAVNSMLRKHGSGMSPYFEQRLTQLLAERGDETEEALKAQEKALEEISSSFVGYRKMTSHHTQTLNDHGFTYTEEGGHYKIIKIGFNSNIYVTLSKTASDSRAGKNFAGDMKKTFFDI